MTNSKGDDMEPAISADGRFLTFTSNREGDSNVYLMDTQQNTLKRISKSKTDSGFAALCPLSKRIAYVSSDGNGAYNIYVTDVNAENEIKLTNSKGFRSQLSWSPDGTQILFRFSKNVKSVEAKFMLVNCKDKSIKTVWEEAAFDTRGTITVNGKDQTVWMRYYENEKNEKIHD